MHVLSKYLRGLIPLNNKAEESQDVRNGVTSISPRKTKSVAAGTVTCSQPDNKIRRQGTVRTVT